MGTRVCDRGQECSLVISTLKISSSFTILNVSSGELQERQVREYIFKNKYLQPDIENRAGYICWTVLFGVVFPYGCFESELKESIILLLLLVFLSLIVSSA